MVVNYREDKVLMYGKVSRSCWYVDIETKDGEPIRYTGKSIRELAWKAGLNLSSLKGNCTHLDEI